MPDRREAGEHQFEWKVDSYWIWTQGQMNDPRMRFETHQLHIPAQYVIAKAFSFQVLVVAFI